MKIALLNDTHFGVRNDSMIFDDFLHKFYEEVFFSLFRKTQYQDTNTSR